MFEPFCWKLMLAPTFLVSFFTMLIQHLLATTEHLSAKVSAGAVTCKDLVPGVRAGRRPFFVPKETDAYAIRGRSGHDTLMLAGFISKAESGRVCTLHHEDGCVYQPQ